ncbi:MAG: peptidase C45, partial [Acidobacteriia bacterium]|nr:peptidase C45 [Terriglobia bacterium]
MRRTVAVLAIFLLTGLAASLMSKGAGADARLKGAFRRPEKNGWTFVHLEGTPAEIGFQHG